MQKYDLEFLNERFICDAERGVIKHRETGRVSGTTRKDGYVVISLWRHNKPNSALRHRLIWAMHHNVSDFDTIDHINGIPGDDRIENLRCVPHHINRRNNRIISTNTSGVTGVAWIKTTQKWRASGYENGKTLNLGEFQNKEDAIIARKQWALENGYLQRLGEPKSYETS